MYTRESQYRRVLSEDPILTCPLHTYVQIINVKFWRKVLLQRIMSLKLWINSSMDPWGGGQIDFITFRNNDINYTLAVLWGIYHSLLRTCIYMLHLFENECNRPILIEKSGHETKRSASAVLVSPGNISATWIYLKSLLKCKLMILFNNNINSYSQSTSRQYVFTCDPLSIV